MLTTLAKVLAELKAQNTTTNDYQLILGYINTVTARVRNISWDFEPFYDTEYFTAAATDTDIFTGRLSLINRKGQRLLLASSTDVPSIVSNGVTINYGTQVVGDPQNYTPIRTLRLTMPFSSNVPYQWYPCGPNWIDTILITGFWGYRRQYGNEGFITSTDSVQNLGGIAAGTTSINVTSVSGADYYFQTPRFSPGQLIRIDNELFLIYATNTNTNTLSVQGAQRGTTAAAHAQNATILTWYPEPSLVQEVTRQAALMYTRRGAFEKVTVNDVATVVYPADLEAQLWGALQEFNNE